MSTKSLPMRCYLTDIQALVKFMVGKKAITDAAHQAYLTMDFLIRDEKHTAVGKIIYQELLNQLQEINGLPEEGQKTVVSFLDAFIKRRNFKELVHS